MNKKCFALIFAAALSANSFAQSDKPKSVQPPSAVTSAAPTGKTAQIKTDATPLELARIAVAAHGGDKFKNIKSLTQIGTVEVTAPNSTQSLPATYKLILSGEKSRFEINSAFFNFQQIYDGETLYSSLGNGEIPAFGRLGINLLAKIETDGYTVSAVADKKKRRSFRVTTPENYTVDFYLDSATGQIAGYDIKFTARSREITSSVEIDRYRSVEGVFVPEKYAQRLEFGQITSYASFKAKEILVNNEIADDVFALPQ